MIQNVQVCRDKKKRKKKKKVELILRYWDGIWMLRRLEMCLSTLERMCTVGVDMLTLSSPHVKSNRSVQLVNELISMLRFFFFFFLKKSI